MLATYAEINLDLVCHDEFKALRRMAPEKIDCKYFCVVVSETKDEGN